MRILTPIFALTTALLTGCAGIVTIPQEGRFEAQPKPAGVRITWLVVADPTAKCKELFPATMASRPIIPACAVWAPNKCVIVTGTVTNHQILGHEVRHCFEGNFHD